MTGNEYRQQHQGCIRIEPLHEIQRCCRPVVIGPCVTREVTNRTVLLSVLIVKVRDVSSKLTCFDGVALNIDDRTLDSKTITRVVGNGVVDDGCRDVGNVNVELNAILTSKRSCMFQSCWR